MSVNSLITVHRFSLIDRNNLMAQPCGMVEIVGSNPFLSLPIKNLLKTTGVCAVKIEPFTDIRFTLRVIGSPT